MCRRPNLVARAFVLVVVGALVLGACGGDDDAGNGSSRVPFVAAFYPLAEAVRHIEILEFLFETIGRTATYRTRGGQHGIAQDS